MLRPVLSTLVLAAAMAANAGTAEKSRDCEAMTPAPHGSVELIIKPATPAARAKLVEVLKNAGLDCVTQFSISGDCLVRYSSAGRPEPQMVAGLLRANINALTAGALNTDQQRFIGDVFVNQSAAIKGDETYGTSGQLEEPKVASTDDPYLNLQSSMLAMRVEDAWQSAGNNRPIVAILDEGVWLDHPDLKVNLLPGITIPCDPSTMACDGSPRSAGYDHGTQVAGVIGAVRENGIGIAGAGFNPLIISINTSTGANDAIYTCGFEIALRRKATVINASWDYRYEMPELYEALKAAPDNVVFVQASASDGDEVSAKHPNYPTLYELPNVIAVGGTLDLDAPLPQSNYSRRYVHIAAEADAYTTHIPQVGETWPYGTVRGTSFSAAYVSSAIALLKSRFPCWNHSWLRWRLLENAVVSKRLQYMSQSQGRLDFAAIMQPVTTQPERVTRSRATLVEWQKGIRGDMCPDVSIQARIGAPENMGSYSDVFAMTTNDGVEVIPAVRLPQDQGSRIQFLVRCTNQVADAESPLIELQ